MGILYEGDCLVESGKIASGSVDLILTDLPYGTMKGFGGSGSISHGMQGKTEWDEAISPKDLFSIVNRILRKNGKAVFFSQEPYTSRLITESHSNVPFSYRMMWEKDHFANALVAKKSPVSYFEDILVFSKSHDVDNLHPLREYFGNVQGFIGLGVKEINNALGHRRAEHSFYVNSTQFSICTENTYLELTGKFNLESMAGYMPFSYIKEIEKSFTSTFNLWEGGKYKSNILRYKKDYNGYHPTQKPVLLLEDLIKTFSNEGDTVVDLTCGSGSTLVAAINTNRTFIGIEREPEYVEIANKRIADAEEALQRRVLAE